MDRVRQTLQKRGTFVPYLTFRYLIHKDHCFKHWIVYTVSEFCHFIKIPTTCTILMLKQMMKVTFIFKTMILLTFLNNLSMI